jgi:chromate reductase, NAD(P)H dehydrogenase (quinone)
MITVISSTNRPHSMTAAVARAYVQMLREQGAASNCLDLQSLPADFAGSHFYDNKSEIWQHMIDEWIIPASTLVFVVPEYQGSFPGVLKVFLDGIAPAHLADKKAAIIGVSDGRAGNLRGQEHLTGILHYLKMHVHYNKPKLSQVNKLIDPTGRWLDDRTEQLMQRHAEAIVGY